MYIGINLLLCSYNKPYLELHSPFLVLILLSAPADTFTLLYRTSLFIQLYILNKNDIKKTSIFLLVFIFFYIFTCSYI